MEYFTFDLLTLLINISNATLSLALIVICKFPLSELDVFTYFCFALWINVNPKQQNFKCIAFRQLKT